MRETDIILTPVHEGRFEIYVNGEKVYDRKSSPETDFTSAHKAIRRVKDKLAEAIAQHGATVA